MMTNVKMKHREVEISRGMSIFTVQGGWEVGPLLPALILIITFDGA